MSILKDAIEYLSVDHYLSPGIDSNKKRHPGRGQCYLSSGIEFSFVGVFCQEIFQRIRQGRLPEYHQFFYIPNLKAEAIVGYDLSIGNYCQNTRVRTMHKVVNETYCDQPWTYQLNHPRRDNDRTEFAQDYWHFIKLLESNPGDLEQLDVQINPYFVINVCYCIHDYRRMGILALVEHSQLTIPSFDSLLRTVIIDLRVLSRQLADQNLDVSSPQFYLRISRQPENRLQPETPREYLYRISNKVNIRIECCGRNIDPQNIILSFDEFFQQNDWNHLLGLDPRVE